MKIALYPGSFDPITKGHEDVVLRLLPLFDKVYIAIGENSEKKTLFPIEQRQEWIQRCFSHIPKVHVISYEGLTVELCTRLEVNYMVRGVRNFIDFQHEQELARLNKELSGIETLFCMASPSLAHISSSFVRELYLNHGNYTKYMPENCFK